MPFVRSGRAFRHAAAAGALTLAVISALAFARPASAAPGDPPASQPPQASIAVDADTGRIVAASNEHEPLLTASTIKILTALVTLEQLPSDAVLDVSRLAAAQPAAKIDMREGSRWPLEQALASLLLVSANDAAYAMAENAGGSLEGFAALAARTGERLGLRDTTFQDPAGLDGDEGFGGGTRSSAYDLAIVARNALTVPAISDRIATLTYEFTDPSGVGRRLRNHNDGFLSTYAGAIGMKTGFTEAANRTFIGAARRDGRTCVAVVLGTWDDTGWAGHLLDECFAAVPGTETGAALPPPRAITFDARQAAYAATPQAFGLGAAAPAATAAPTEPAPRAEAPSAERAAEPTTRPTAAPDPAPATAGRTSSPAAEAAAGGGTATTTSASGWTLRRVATTAGLVVLALLAVLVILRRRAVKRRRARRLAHQRAHAEARRRGMIDVIEPDDSELRLTPSRTSHHVSATGRRNPADRHSDRRVVHPTRPRQHGTPDRRR